MRASESTFPTTGGLRLQRRSWLPESDPRGVLAICHGYAEHSGRYACAGEQLAARGYAVHAFDLRGHGRSGGERVFIRSANEYLDDLDAFLAVVRDEHPGLPLFLLGHSMGGGIVALAMVTRRPAVDGVLLSGAPLPTEQGLGARIGMQLAVIIGKLFPRWRTRSLAAATVSRDPAVVADYDADPLNYRGKMPAGLLSALVRAGRVIDRRESSITEPLLIMHGSDDQLTDPDGSRELYTRAASADKTLRIYDGLYHEILNEPERNQVIAHIAGWLDERTPDRAPARQTSESSAAG